MRVRTFLKQQLRRVGLEVSRFNSPDSFTARRQRLLEYYGVNLVLDVGASDGGFALELRSAGYQGRIVSFEPLLAPFKSLQVKSQRDTNWESMQIALGDEPGESSMFVTMDDKCSSLLQPLDRQTQAYAGSTTKEMATVRIECLDTIFPQIHGSGDIPFLKIDTQGYEQHVLSGGSTTLASMHGLQVELSIVALYGGSPRYFEMLRFMEDAGFTLMALEPVFSDPVTEQLLQIDTLFFRTSD